MEYNPRADGIKELSKQFAANPALVSQSIMESLGKVSSSIVWSYGKNNIPKAEEESFRLGMQMMYSIYRTELLQHPDKTELVNDLVASAEQLLYLLPNAPAANQAEWAMQRFEKLRDASRLPMNIMENPSLLTGLTDAQAQQVGTALGITLNDRVRLARMLQPMMALPDNADWKALKAGEPLAEAIRVLATYTGASNRYTGAGQNLLLGTLAACTQPGERGLNESMEKWKYATHKLTGDGPTLAIARTAARNRYRAVVLKQGGYEQRVRHLKGKSDAREMLNTEFGGADLEYQNALVMLDQSPDFPPIGSKQKSVAHQSLAALAARGYEPAKAKLKEL